MNNKGFSLIEFLLYMAILVIAVTGINLVAVNIFQTTAKSEAIEEVSYNGQFVMHKIKSNISNSNSITRPTTEGTELEIAQDGSSLIFKVEEDKIVLEKGSNIINLTTSKITIKRLNFKRISNNSIRINLKLANKNAEDLPEKNIENVFISSAGLE